MSDLLTTLRENRLLWLLLSVLAIVTLAMFAESCDRIRGPLYLLPPTSP